MERIEIPLRATRMPVALTDIAIGAPLASRLLLGAIVPGQVLAIAALGYYAGSATRDWLVRRGVRYVDFQAEYGSDVSTLVEMGEAARHEEVARIAAALDAGYTAEKYPRAETAARVGRRLTAYLSTLTDQEVVVSSELREYTLARVLAPFALGSCDPLGGDIAIFKDTGLFEPHIIAHELCHRIGYWKELHAQVIAFLALRTSGDPVLVQSARAERLPRHLAVLSGSDPARFHALLDALPVRPELKNALGKLRPVPGSPTGAARALRALYDKRMRLTGQNGVSDYDAGFTTLLATVSRSAPARQPRHHADP
jgi:hypothetical protein